MFDRVIHISGVPPCGDHALSLFDRVIHVSGVLPCGDHALSLFDRVIHVSGVPPAMITLSQHSGTNPDVPSQPGTGTV
ncbi:MAG TPA: hypothetical protein VN702_21575 [Acetobacteraceae bacterium]|nr:hypothetical protein [Acetobacteraceae bacterium]